MRKRSKTYYTKRVETVGSGLLMDEDKVFRTIKLLKAFNLDPKKYCKPKHKKVKK